MKKLLICLVILLNSFIILCNGQGINFKESKYNNYSKIGYYIKQHPYLTSIIKIEQTDDHKIWILCEKGIVMYNGITFYTQLEEWHENGKKPKIKTIKAIKNNLYILTQEGDLFQIKGNQQIAIAKSNSNQEVQEIIGIDYKNHIYLLGNKGLYKEKEGNYIKIQDSVEYIHAMNYNMYVVKNNGNILRLDKDKFETIYKLTTETKGLSNFLATADNEFWYIKDKMVIHETHKEGQTIYQNFNDYIDLKKNDQGNIVEVPLRIDKYEDNNILITTTNNIYLYDSKSNFFYKLNFDFKNINIKSLFIDKAKNIWIGTLHSGIIKLEKSAVITLNIADSLLDFNITALLNQNGKTLALNDKEQFVIDENFEIQFPTGIKNGKGQSAYVDYKNRLWIIVEETLYFSDNLPHFYEYPTPKIPSIDKIFVTSNGSLWLSSKVNNNIYIINKEENLQIIGENEGLNNNTKLELLIEDSNKKVYMLFSDKSIYTKTGNLYKKVKFSKNLGSPRTILPFTDGTILISTREKIFIFDRVNIDLFFDYSEHNPYSIIQVLRDQKNNIFINSNKNIIKLDRIFTQNFKRKGIKASDYLSFYDREFGLTNGAIFGISQSSIDNENNLWFYSLKGVSILENSSLDAKYPSPITTIESIQLDGEKIKTLDEISIRNKSKELTFYFSSISKSVSPFTTIEYRLKGLDNNWTVNDYYQDKVTFNLTEGGEYIFEVRGFNKNRERYSIATIPFTVNESMSLANILYILIVPLIIAFSLGYYYLILSRNSATKNELNYEINRLKQIENKKTDSLIKEFGYHYNNISILVNSTKTIYKALARNSETTLEKTNGVTTKENIKVIPKETLKYILSNIQIWSFEYHKKVPTLEQEYNLSEILDHLKQTSEPFFNISQSVWNYKDNCMIQSYIPGIVTLLLNLLNYFKMIRVQTNIEEIKLISERYHNYIYFRFTPDAYRIIFEKLENEQLENINKDSEVINTTPYGLLLFEIIASKYEFSINYEKNNEQIIKLMLLNSSGKT